MGKHRFCWESLKSLRIVPALTCGEKWRRLEGLSGGTESVDSQTGMDSQSKGGHLFVLPFSPVGRELEALKLERNPQGQLRY